jgi:tRNA pseudouridine65 synthase
MNEAEAPESLTQPTELTILYQDARFAVVNKPAGLLVHPSGLAPDRITAMSLLRDQLGQHVYPVHRLDRGTSGVLCFGLSPDAARLLHNALAKALCKRYVTLVRGNYDGPAKLDYPVPKDEGTKERVDATTSFRVLEKFDYCTWLEARPITGRYHQIRRHLSHLRFPIANDTKYGTGWFNRKVRAELGLSRLALHCASLTLTLTLTQESASQDEAIHVDAPLPTDLAAALTVLRTAAHTGEPTSACSPRDL